jgi:hypothetical protein
MTRTKSWWFFPVLSIVLTAAVAHAITIDPQDLETFGSPCTLSVSQINSDARLLSWSSVQGAASYKVGYQECKGNIVGLAELTGLSYTHTGWDADECLEYVLVAYDSSGLDICCARAEAGSCPCP